MKNGLSGSSVNISKIKIHLSACRRRHADVAADQISPLPRALTRSWCHGGSVRALSSPGSPFLAINSNSRRRRPHFSPLLCSAARRSHRRAVSIMPSYANAIASVLRFSMTCSCHLSWPESPDATASSPSPAGALPPSPRRGQAIPDRLCLHQAHRRDRGELLNVMFTSLLTLPHSC